MVKLQEFQIRLASANAVYQAGDVVSGDLIVRLNRPMEATGIRITFNGKASVHWTERHKRGSGKRRSTVTVHYRGNQKFFNHTVYVFGKDSRDEKLSISQGEHVYPFSYLLPSPLPSSYEDYVGHVRYHVMATIVKPWKFNRRTMKPITVLDTLDLNSLPKATQPAKGSESKHLCCLCCKSGPISAEFQADRSAYVPGEFVTINATLKNKSNSKVKETSVSLMQKITYHASQKSKVNYVTLAQISGQECPKGKTINWVNEKLQIPPVPPTETTHCKVIDVEYYLMFQGHLRTCAIDLREYEAIVIGTVPIRSLDIYQNISSQQSVLPSAPEAALPSSVVDEPKQRVTATAVPPRAIYKAGEGQATNLAAEDDDGNTMGDTSFAPQYTFYDWSQTAFTY